MRKKHCRCDNPHVLVERREGAAQSGDLEESTLQLVSISSRFASDDSTTFLKGVIFYFTQT